MARSCMRRWLLVIGCGLIGSSLCGFQPCQAQDVAEQKLSESSQAALLLYAEAAGYQNNKQFDLAAGEWERFLKEYAEDPRATEARYNLAVCQIQEKEFTKAVENLKQVVATADADFERMEDVYLNLGWSQYSVGLENQPEYFAAASTTFQQLLAKYPDSEVRDQALFFGGESLYLQGKFKEAAESYAELVEKHTDSKLHSDAMYALGVTYEDMKQYEDAGNTFTGFLEKYQDHDLATEVRMRKAETVLQAGNFEDAAKMFAAVAETAGFQAVDHARYRQAFCVAQAGDYAAAAKVFAAIATEMEQSPYAKDSAIAAGRAYYRAKDFENARKWFELVRTSDSQHAPEAAHWQARILLDAGQPEQARDLVAAVIPAAQDHPFLVSLKLDDADALYEMKPTQKTSVAAYLKIADDHRDHHLAPKALYNAAYGAMEVGDYKNGLAYANRFEADYPEHSLTAEVRKVLAECKLQLGDHDEAAKEYQKLAAEGDEDGIKFQLRRGLSLFLNHNYDDAIAVLQQVYQTTDSADQKAESSYWLGRSHAAKNDFEAAIQAFEASQAANPAWEQSDEVLLNLARAMRQSGRIDDATSTVTKMIAAYPRSEVLDQAHYRLAEFSYAGQDYPRAIESYSQVITTWPESKLVPFSLYGRGWSHLRSGAADKGLADFETLQQQYPEHELISQTIYARGMALHQSGQHEAALKVVNVFFDTDPEGASKSDALYLKGLCHVGLKDLDAAIETFAEILQTDDSYASRDKVLYEMAWAHKNKSADAEALAAFGRLVEEAPDSPLAAEAFYHIGENFYADKDYAQAAKRYESALALANAGDLREKASYKLGWAHYQQRQFDQALSSFDKQLTVNDQGNLAADAEFMRGECLFKEKQFAEALAAYERAKSNPSKNETMQVLTYLHAGQAAAQLEQWETSADWIAELQGKFPESPYLPLADYEQGWALRNLGQLDAALESFQRVMAVSRNELGARARFMAGEVLFEKKDYTNAILEFRKVMYGYGAEKAPASIKRWQAKSAFEAGRCATLLASNEGNPQRRSQLVEGARGFFRYVTDMHADSDEATAAKQQLERLQPQGSRISNRAGAPGV